MKHFNDAPPLLELTEDQTCKLLEYEGDKDNSDEESKEANNKYVMMLFHKYESKTIPKFFGTMIIDYFKTTNLEKRQVWATDVSRLSFIVMETINKKGEKEWKNDKSGKKFISLVMAPMLKKVSDLLGEFVSNQLEELSELAQYDSDIQQSKRENMTGEMHMALLIQKQIRDGIFEAPILKHVAPHFNFDSSKDVNEVETKSKKIKKFIK